MRLFAGAREAVGAGTVHVDAATVADAVGIAVSRGGQRLVDLLPTCKVWLNGDEVDHVADGGHPLDDADELAILPPVSGGCGS